MNSPHIAQKILNYGAAILNHALHGAKPAPQEEINRRIKICKQCQFYANDTCSLCGCTVNAAPAPLRNKAAMLSERCPLNKWNTPWIINIQPGTFIRTVQLTALVNDVAVQLADDFKPDAIAGLARSGVLAAAQIATMLHKPLLSVSVSNDTVADLGTGVRGLNMPRQDLRRILLVDDTVVSGRTLLNAHTKLANAFPAALIATMAIYADTKALTKVHYPIAHYPLPHFLEWNWSNSFYVPQMAVDLDGLLCPDPPQSALQTKEHYIDWLKHVKPHPYRFVRQPVPAIITMRPKELEHLTAKWLEQWGIFYEELHCWPGATEDIRRYDDDETVRWKSSVIEDLKKRKTISMYVDSHWKLAKAIAQRTGITPLGIKA